MTLIPLPIANTRFHEKKSLDIAREIDAMWADYKNQTSNPLKLTIQCKDVIRCSMKQQPITRDAVDSLDLPRKMRDFIVHEDLAVEILDHVHKYHKQFSWWTTHPEM